MASRAEKVTLTKGRAGYFERASHRASGARVFPAGSYVLELCLNSSRGDSHDDCLRCADFFLRYPFFLGNAKVPLHSGITRKRHGRTDVKQQCRLWIQNLVLPGRFVEPAKGHPLIFREHYLVLLHLLVVRRRPNVSAQAAHFTSLPSLVRLTCLMSCETSWRGPRASKSRDRTDRQLQGNVNGP